MRARRTVGPIAIAGLTLLGALALLVPIAQAAFPGRDGQIAYGTAQTAYEIGALGPGSIEAVTPRNPQHPTVLVEGDGLKPPGAIEAQVEAPSYSADGQQIAFAASWTPAGGYQSEGRIFTMSASGADVHQLTTESGVTDSDPGFSPSGEQIVFDRTEPASKATQIYRIDADGSGLLQLTKDPNGEDDSPRYSPNGKEIVFDSSKGIEEISPSGGARHQLVADQGKVKAYEADFSPNGKLIAFVKAIPKKGALFIAKANGRDARLVSPRQKGGDGCGDFYCPRGPVFSPDGKRIVYEQENTYNMFLAVVSVTGKPRESHELNLPGGDSPSRPSWQSLP
jgi:Tol biopolymer transport system component